MANARTFSELLTECSNRFGDRPFLIDDPILGPVSYSDVLHFAIGLEEHFDQLGIPRGAPVATLFHNCGLAALLFLGTIASGRVLVPLNPLSTQYELDFVLDHAQCCAVMVDPRHVLSDGYGGREALRISDHLGYFADRCGAGAAKMSELKMNMARNKFVGEIVFTSGSTGRPKGVVLSERSLLANASSIAAAYKLTGTDRFLTICPLFHNSGQLLTTLACALVGGSTAAVKSDVGMLNFWSYFDKYRAQWTLAMNSFLALLMTRKELPKYGESIKAILTGGSAIDGQLVSDFEARFGVPVRTVYGLTETSSISTCEHLDPSPRSLGSSGRPLATCHVRIGASPFVAQIVPCQAGQIWISGPHLFDGYVNDPDLTRSRMRGGWLDTGDIGYFDDCENLHVVDRADSMLIVGGENVYPAEVEKLRTLLPGDPQIAVVGVDHAIWGKEIVVVYKTCIEEKAQEALWHRIFSNQLSAAKIPQRYVSIRELGLEEFPRRPNGKLDKPAIQALLTARIKSLCS